MLGDLANALVGESSRSQQTRTLLAYNTTAVRLISREIRSLDDQLRTADEIYQQTQQAEYDQGQVAELTITALALRRNKRALFVYHGQRLETIEDIMWESGGLTSLAFKSDSDSKKHLATVDEAFSKTYERLLLEYRNDEASAATDVLSGGVESLIPPTELFVLVRSLYDIGEIETSSGKINLTKGSQCFMHRDDVANLIVQGLLEEVA